MKKSSKAQGPEAAKDDPSAWRWADPKSLKVNPAFQGLIPLQSRGEHLALSESIRAEGCRDPLLVWKGRDVVLDGHTRRDLCIEHKKPVKVRDVELADEKAAVEYILRIQRQRRNLTREAMSYFRGSEYNAVKKGWGGRRPARKTKMHFGPLPTTAVLLAEKYGVSAQTVKRDGIFARVIDKIVLEHGDPEVKRRLLGADVKLTQGTAVALLRMAAEDRKAALEHLLEQGEPLRAKRASVSSLPPKEAAQSILARLKAKGAGHARSVVQHLARLLGLEVVEQGSHD